MQYTVFLQRWEVPVGHPMMILCLFVPKAGPTCVTPSLTGTALPKRANMCLWSQVLHGGHSCSLSQDNSCDGHSTVCCTGRFVSWGCLKGLLYPKAAGIWSEVKEPSPATPNIRVDIYRAASKLPQHCRSLCRGKTNLGWVVLQPTLFSFLAGTEHVPSVSNVKGLLWRGDLWPCSVMHRALEAVFCWKLLLLKKEKSKQRCPVE